MAGPTRVAISPDELLPLREAMRDIQESVAAYYRETARGGDLGGHVRNFLVRVQTLNEHMGRNIADRASYESRFAIPLLAGAELINAVRYARNVNQHVLHIVQPKSDVLFGGSLGYRTYAFWEEVPPTAHAKLHPRTQALKPAYDRALKGQEVTGTMLTALQFFADTAPDIVHRDARGEWSGFPLMNQPNTLRPNLHPEEPTDLVAARLWLDGRRPNADARVVCGQVTVDEARYLVGLTFVGRYSFSPFVETAEQVDRDIAAGVVYLRGEPAANIEIVTERFPGAKQGQVFWSRGEVASWASSFTRTPDDADWLTFFGDEDWRRMVRLEHPGLFPDSVAYEIRRARRLNAFVP